MDHEAEKITKDEFLEYEILRKQGAINMLHSDVRVYTSLTEKKHRAIIENYDELKAKFKL